MVSIVFIKYDLATPKKNRWDFGSTGCQRGGINDYEMELRNIKTRDHQDAERNCME